MGIIHKGVAASPGIAIGTVQVYHPPVHQAVELTVPDADGEAKRFLDAITASVEDLEALERKIATDTSLDEEHGKILEAHKMILQDPEFANSIAERIRMSATNAEWVLTQKTDELVGMFEAMDNDYMRQRAADIRDISGRVMAHLLNVSYGFNVGDATDVVLVAEDLHPSDTIQLDLTKVRGFVTDVGGRTSHTAIMARTRGIPAVVGTQSLSREVDDGTLVVVDGEAGEVLIQPADHELTVYRQRAQGFQRRSEELQKLVHLKSETKDGYQIELAANIGVPDDVKAALEHGAEGVGLFRSEFLFMNRNSLPSEAEQFAAYRQAAENLAGRPLIIRTMDIGGDKSVDYLNLPHELNPFLGYRAIRISLKQQDLLRNQLRAVLRASHYGRVKVMYPMIATMEEVLAAKAVFESVKAELQQEGIPYDNGVEQGIMIEIPAAAIAADLIAPEVDFFSIGTNDLIQYTMACDRMNEQVAYLYQPYHPSVLRLVKTVIDAAHQHGKWVGMCGEMAGDVAIAPALVGMGIDELSMSPTSILPVREAIRQSDREHLTELAANVLQQPTSDRVNEVLQEYGQRLRQ